MRLDAAQILSMLQLSDSLFPTGAFTHSNGLETYTDQGMIRDAAALQALIATRLIYGSAHLELIVVRAAMRAYLDQDYQAVRDLDERLSAMKTTKESRDASAKVGRQLLRNLLALADDDLLAAYQGDINAGLCMGHHALVHGLIYACLGVDPAAAMLAFAYGQVAGQVSAAVKLMIIGQTAAQQLLRALQPTMQQAVKLAQDKTLDDCQSFLPALEIRVMQHQYLFRRLFSS
jgi:urease accessory protein